MVEYISGIVCAGFCMRVEGISKATDPNVTMPLEQIAGSNND
jgi:hypothetical protein